MSVTAPEASELSRLVVMGRLLSCFGPPAKAVAARQKSKRLRSFMVVLLQKRVRVADWSSFLSQLCFSGPQSIRPPGVYPVSLLTNRTNIASDGPHPHGFLITFGLATNPRRWSETVHVPAIC